MHRCIYTCILLYTVSGIGDARAFGVTSNKSESFNYMLKGLQTLPVDAIVLYILKRDSFLESDLFDLLDFNIFP